MTPTTPPPFGRHPSLTGGEAPRCCLSTMNPYNPAETKLFKRLNSPKKIQDFLALKIRHNPARDGVECRSPRRVLREGKAHCMEGALLAAAILEFHGHKPLLLDLRSTSDDLDHVVALFSQFGCWGAISKTNHVVLRYREPIYKSIRELALSYFHEYFLDSGKKTLREYSAPVNVSSYHPPLTPPLKGGETANPPSFSKRGLGGVTDIRMLLQVHDELVFEVAEDKVEFWAKKLVPLMENAIKLSVPVSVEAKVGDNWGEMKSIEQNLNN